MMLDELIKGVKQAFPQGIQLGKMLIDREKMLVLPFRKTCLQSGFLSGLQIPSSRE